MALINPQRKIQFLAGIIALLLTIPMCYDMLYGMVLGFNSPEITDVLEYESYPSGFEIKPENANDMQSIDTNIGSLKVSDIKRETMIYMPSQIISPSVSIICTIISFVAIVITIYYIISVIKFTSTIMRQGIMNNMALTQLRKVSYSMLTAYVLFTLATYIPTFYYSKIIDIEGYTLSYPRISESFVIAIIFILLTEILNITLKLKEEQDLTI